MAKTPKGIQKRKPKCENCGSSERPMVFKGLEYCSDNCRKALAGDNAHIVDYTQKVHIQ